MMQKTLLSGLLAGFCLWAAAAKVECDFSKPDAGKKWNAYPSGAQLVLASPESTDGKKALQFDLRKKAGHINYSIPKRPGEVLQSVSFSIKALPDSKPETLEVMLLESDDEIYFTTIKLTQTWKKYTIPLSGFVIYPYGGAKFRDGKLSPENITAFRFNNYPQGRNFLLAGLTFQYGKSSASAAVSAPAAKKEFRINPVRMPENAERYHSRFPSDMQDISIRGNSFFKEGKPHFMLGIWQLDVEIAPWLMRLNAADVSVYNADEIYTLYSPKKNAQGEPVFEWCENPWYEAILTRMTANNIRVWHEHKAGPEFSVMRRTPECAEVRNAGHFVPYDPYHPRGEECYREMFKTWMRYTKKYPLFCYELFNEMGYFNSHKISRDAFRDSMRKKFGNDISRLNTAWKTSFKSFADVDAPGFLQDHGTLPLPRETLFRREGSSYPNLLTDWIKFQEDRCYGAVKNLMSVMRSYDTDKKVFSTIQAHMNLGLDYGDGGVPPEALTDFSDFYSHELGQAFAESGEYRDYSYICGMLKPAMFNDLVSGICPDKPVFNAESPITVLTRGATEAVLRASDLADMHNGWKFFDATKGEPQQWFKNDFSDASWGKVKVPAMWADSGYLLCQVGLYRKHFRMTPAQLKQKLYFNGKGFADQSDIYLNGEKIGSARGYDASFTFDLTGKLKENNTIAVRIENRYFSGGMYFGGIRGCVSINHNELAPSIRRSLEPRHVRSFFWTQVTHGMNGVMYSYDANHFIPPARFLAPVKAEINSVADLLFRKENRPASEVAFVYPQEDLRGVIHKDFLVKLSGPATTDLMPYYVSFFANHFNPAVIRQKDMIAGKLPYRLLVMPNLRRIRPEASGKLMEFVRNGGSLVLNYGGLEVNEETHLPFDSSALTGVKSGAFSDAESKISVKNLGNGTVKPRFLDGKSGVSLHLNGAKCLYSFADGSPAVTVHTLGKGRVYTIAANFDHALLNKLLMRIAQTEKITPAMTLLPLKGFLPEYVDVRLFGQPGKSRLLYLLNFDLSGMGTLRLSESFTGNWRLRLPRGNKLLRSPSGKELWSAEELNRGIPVRLNQFDPVVILMEPETTAPRRIVGLSPERLAMLNELWKETPSKPGQPNVALTPISTMTLVHGVIPTARKILTDHGFNVRELKSFSGVSKRDTDVLILQGLRSPWKNPDELVKFVQDGGGLLICGGAFLNYHTPNNNWKLLRRFGLADGGLHSALYNSAAKPPEDNLTVRCRDFGKHPVTENVGEFVSAGANCLTEWPKDAQILLRSPADSNFKGKPLMVALTFGKGRVIYLGDHWFLRPLSFEKGGNAQLLHNAVSWLAGKTPRVLSGTELKNSLFITSDRLKRAEEQEKKGIYSYEEPALFPSYLRSADDSDFSGLSGGDPVIDLLKSF